MNEMTRYKVAGETANARFGGLNYLSIGRSKEAQDILRLTMLAPDWLESQVRDLGLAMKYPGIGGFDLARISLYTFVAARVLNYMNTGQAHLEEPFGVVSDDGKKVFGVRTLPGDLANAIRDPRYFLSNRLNPTIARTGFEFFTGKDRLGHDRTMPEELVDFLSNATPISLQGTSDKLFGHEKPGASPWDSARSALGATTSTNLSPAEQLAFKLSSGRSNTGAVPADQLERHHLVYDLEDRMRDKDPTAWNEALDKYKAGQLTQSDVKQIMTESQKTRLESSTKNLPLANSLDVWDRATDKEREKLAPIMGKKMQEFATHGAQKLTEPERLRIATRTTKLYNDVRKTSPD